MLNNMFEMHILKQKLAFWNEISNFAATVPATPLLESVPRQDFVFLYYIK